MILVSLSIPNYTPLIFPLLQPTNAPTTASPTQPPTAQVSDSDKALDHSQLITSLRSLFVHAKRFSVDFIMMFLGNRDQVGC